MNKKKLHGQPSETPTYRKRIDKREQKQVDKSFEKLEFTLKDSDQPLSKHNIETISLYKEYLALNDELTESIRRIQGMKEDLMFAKDKAQESDKLKSAFLANILHEVNTPMNAIIGFSDLLMDIKFSKVKTNQFVEIINASCKQLLTVISDIIDISKIEADQIIINKKLINIGLLLKDIHTTYEKQLFNKKVKLIYSVKPEYFHIETITDSSKLKQVLCNLINNAIKFTQQGEVEFGFDIKGDFIEFYVKDSGIGIAHKNQAIIFERFRQVETTNSRLYGGNGLGLSIAKAMVEKLGGAIAVKSEPEKGSTFIFTIPYIHNINIKKSTKNSIKVNPSVNWAGKTILIVEDEIFNHLYIEEALSFTNVNIFHAWNGEKAIEMVKNHSTISLVLMDIKMPVINGYEATQRIKDTNPKLPVVAITAYVLSHTKENALQAGFDNYISKPIPKDTLIKVIAGYLN